MSRKGLSRPGYVGTPYDDVECRIAEDGEIQVKTPGKMMGYYKNEEATKETLTEDGYVRTGDKGEIDSKGRLKITGRIKEIFETSKGKYVAPAPIETKLINHAMAALEKHLKAVNSSVDGHGVSQFMVVIKDAWLPD